jgi:hypothetical protein
MNAGFATQEYALDPSAAAHRTARANLPARDRSGRWRLAPSCSARTECSTASRSSAERSASGLERRPAGVDEGVGMLGLAASRTMYCILAAMKSYGLHRPGQAVE